LMALPFEDLRRAGDGPMAAPSQSACPRIVD